MIAIRAAAFDDAGAIAAIYAPHVTSGVVSFETEAPDAEAMRGRMTAGEARYPWLVATDGPDGDLLGYAYAGRFRDRPAYRFAVETTIYVADAAQGQGVGRQLYGALLAALGAHGFTQAIGVIALPNDASVGLHEAVGFRRAGEFAAVGHKFGRWVDVGYWQRALGEIG